MKSCLWLYYKYIMYMFSTPEIVVYLQNQGIMDNRFQKSA